MATLSTTRTYDDGEVLVRADLDAFLDDVETFLNVTKINDDNIQNSGITGSTKLLNQSVTEAKLAADSVTTNKIATSAVTTAKIADSAVTTAKINDSAVTTAKINDSAVTTAKINDDAVTQAKIADDAVGADQLQDDVSVDANRAVTTNHIRDAAVTTAKINDAAVTGAKLSIRYVTGTTGTGATISTNTTLASGLSITGSRAVKVTIYGGRLSTALISGTLTLQAYDGVTGTTLVTLGQSGVATPTYSFGASAYSVFNSADFSGSLVVVTTTLSAGTYSFRLVPSGGSYNIQVALQTVVEEL